MIVVVVLSIALSATVLVGMTRFRSRFCVISGHQGHDKELLGYHSHLMSINELSSQFVVDLDVLLECPFESLNMLLIFLFRLLTESLSVA